MPLRTHYLWEIRPYYRRVSGLLFLGFVSGIIMNIAVVLPAILLGRAIDLAQAAAAGNASSRSVILAAAAYVGGCSLNLVAQIGKRWWLRTANHRTVANMRANALRGVLSWSMEALHSEPVGDIMARIVGDTRVFMTAFNEATTELLDTWLFSISLFTAMMFYDVRLALMAMALVPLAFLLAYFAGNWVRSRTLAMREASSVLTMALREYLGGLRLLRLFGLSAYAVNRVDALSETQRQANLSETRLRLGLQPVYSIIVTAGILMVVWLGGQRVVERTLTTGALVAFIQLYMRFVRRGHRIPMFFNRIQAGGVAYTRLKKMLATVTAAGEEPAFASFMPGRITGLGKPPVSQRPSGSGPLSVSVQSVVFRYPDSDENALNGVSMDLPRGSFIAVTGPLGSGKTALLHMLVGLYAPIQGCVLIDGKTPVTWEDRPIRVSYLPQQADLFSGSVRENIGRDDVDEKWVREIIARSGLERDIEEFPQGMDTVIGEGGIRISGGQRQRVALARALAAGNGSHPGLILLDDPFSSIDVETEKLIITSLRDAYGPLADEGNRATIVLCSHRLAAFPLADRVIVLDRGRIVEQGTHADLLAEKGFYERVYSAQHRIERWSGGK